MFLFELILFVATMALGLATAYRYEALTSGAPIIQAPALTALDALFLAVIVTLLIAMTRSNRFARKAFWVFLTLVLIAGSQAVLGLVAPFPWDLLGSLAVAAVFILWRTVLVHDLGIMLALAGIGAAIGLSITPTVGIIALVLLSFYDIIAVYKTRHMVRMAEGMVQSGAIFGFVIPRDLKSSFASRHEARAGLGERFMLLGSGDIGLPVIFASSLMRQSVAEAVTVGVFAALGLAVTHILFINQPKRQAMAALPPIATMCLVGYLVSLFIFPR